MCPQRTEQYVWSLWNSVTDSCELCSGHWEWNQVLCERIKYFEWLNHLSSPLHSFLRHPFSKKHHQELLHQGLWPPRLQGQVYRTRHECPPCAQVLHPMRKRLVTLPPEQLSTIVVVGSCCLAGWGCSPGNTSLWIAVLCIGNLHCAGHWGKLLMGTDFILFSQWHAGRL